jgi:formylglycine-generating enzyme required for sulfatase activity
VNWWEAASFCRRLSFLSGQTVQLPTSAQWEYACRAGTTTALNSGKNLTSTAKCSNMDEVGWYEFNSEETLHAVGLKKPNDWRLYDMHGNVYEWCLDWYEDFPATPVTDPMGPATGTKRVFRGGCYYFSGRDCRSGLRYGDYPTDEYWGSGFRVALAPVQ